MRIRKAGKYPSNAMRNLSAYNLTRLGQLRTVRNRGLTLVEVMVAIVVLAVAIIGAAAFLAGGSRILSRASNQRAAEQVAHMKLEAARAGGYEALADSNGSETVDGVAYTWSIVVATALADPADADSTYKRMTATVDWPTSGGSPVIVESAMAP